jgi:hypothetical protein
MTNKTSKCKYKYVNLLYYNQHNLLYVLATYCVAIFWEVFLDGYILYYIDKINILYFNIDFKPFTQNLTFYTCKMF